jgi:hypothetical protein
MVFDFISVIIIFLEKSLSDASLPPVFTNPELDEDNDLDGNVNSHTTLPSQQKMVTCYF